MLPAASAHVRWSVFWSIHERNSQQVQYCHCRGRRLGDRRAGEGLKQAGHRRMIFAAARADPRLAEARSRSSASKNGPIFSPPSSGLHQPLRRKNSSKTSFSQICPMPPMSRSGALRQRRAPCRAARGGLCEVCQLIWNCCRRLACSSGPSAPPAAQREEVWSHDVFSPRRRWRPPGLRQVRRKRRGE